MKWWVYIIQSTVTDRLYTGVSLDPRRRLQEHNTSPKGAKATKAGRPWTLIYLEEVESRGAALRREGAIKRLPRPKKLELVSITTT